jgi:hypothetical protein
MSRRTPQSDRSELSPLRRGQLLSLPLSALAIGPLLGLFFFRLLGWPTVLALGAAVSGVMVLLAGWIAYRSDFGGRQGIAGAALMLLFLIPFMSGAAVMTLSLAGLPQLSLLAVGTCSLSLAMAFVAGFRRQWLPLRNEGFDGAWARTNVDPAEGRLRASALLDNNPDAASTSPWLIAALAANVPLLYRTWGVSDAQVMPFVLAVLAVISVWACARKVGPMAARGWFVLQLERHHGRRIVHEHLEELQALRRGFWLSRLLMVDAAGGPASTGDSDARLGESRAQRLRRYAENTLYALAFLFLLAGGMGFFLLGWPSWQQSLYFDGFHPADVIVTEVAITGRGSKWVGRGRVDGADVVFAPGDLDPVIGVRPQWRDDPQLIVVRARLPIRAEVLWNPQLQRRLLPLGTNREVVERSAWFNAAGTSALAAFGVLLMLLAGQVSPSDKPGTRKRKQRRDQRR